MLESHSAKELRACCLTPSFSSSRSPLLLLAPFPQIEDCLGHCVDLDFIQSNLIQNGVCNSCSLSSPTCTQLALVGMSCQCIIFDNALVDLDCAKFDKDGGDCIMFNPDNPCERRR